MLTFHIVKMFNFFPPNRLQRLHLQHFIPIMMVRRDLPILNIIHIPLPRHLLPRRLPLIFS